MWSLAKGVLREAASRTISCLSDVNFDPLIADYPESHPGFVFLLWAQMPSKVLVKPSLQEICQD